MKFSLLLLRVSGSFLFRAQGLKRYEQGGCDGLGTTRVQALLKPEAPEPEAPEP